jgi:hypothetical protein
MSSTEPEINEEAVAQGFAMAGLTDATPEEQEAELAQIGTLLVERAFTKFLNQIDESDGAALETFLAEYAEQDDFVERLIETYPIFATLLDEETRAYRATLEQVLGDVP